MAFFEHTPFDDKIHILYRHQAVHVRADRALLEHLRRGVTGTRKGHMLPALEIARYIKKKYADHFHEELQISDHSLALELMIHMTAFMGGRSLDRGLSYLRLSEQNPVRRFVRYVADHVEVIDCGEKAIDTNRFVFDIAATIRPLVYPAEALSLWIIPFRQCVNGDGSI